MEEKRGDDVVLRCFLEPEFNLSAKTLDWSRVDLKEPNEVHVYRSKRDDPTAQIGQYKNRTTLNHEELSRGIGTLLISSVQPSDSGLYQCYIPKLKVGCTINLTVVEEDQQSTTGPPEEDVTEPNNANFPSDAAKMEPQRKIPVAAIVVVVVFVVVVVVVFLVKRGKIQIGKKTQEAETTSTEMENLMPQTTTTTTTTTDQHNAAGNVQRESVVDIGG